MRPAGGVADFLAAPVGRYLTGTSFLYWWAEPTLCGFTLWGRPDEPDVRRLTRVLEAERQPGIPVHASLVDARRLEGVDSAAFRVLHEFLDRSIASFAPFVTRQALLRPAGLMGAVVAGFYQVRAPAYPVKVFTDPRAALRWLGHKTPSILEELDALVGDAMGAPPVVRALREHLAAGGPGATLPSAARALHLSARTLQRRLAEAGTTFQAEHNRAQVHAAQALLLDTDAKLTAVALDVGCASLQHFSAMFRRVTGESPSAWRARRRR